MDFNFENRFNFVFYTFYIGFERSDYFEIRQIECLIWYTNNGILCSFELSENHQYFNNRVEYQNTPRSKFKQFEYEMKTVFKTQVRQSIHPAILSDLFSNALRNEPKKSLIMRKCNLNVDRDFIPFLGVL